MSKRLAVLASHPIHYQAPLWRLLAADLDLELKVFFRSGMGLQPYHDPEFNATIKWDLPLASGYDHVMLKGPWDLFGRLRRDHYDALLVHAWNSPAIWLAVLGAKLSGGKVLLRGESPWNQEAGKSGPRHLLKRAALKIFFAMIDGFLYIGEENRRFYLHYGIPERKLFFTPYAVENSRFFKEEDRLRGERARVRAELGLSKDAIVLLSVGKLIHKKRHMDLLRAYENVPGPDKTLVIVGEGESRHSLEKYVTERGLKNVQFAGFVGQTDISRYYAAADIFVLPSGVGETWGLVVNEAMCFGLPVIVSNIAGSAADLVHSGENGYVFHLGDVAELARKISLLAEQPELRRKFGQRSKQIIREYTYDADAAGISKALKTLT